jgi:hypothetical protein
MGAAIYGSHHIFSPQAFSRQKLGLVYQPLHKCQLFGIIHAGYHKIVIHCKVFNHLEALFYSCTKIKDKM